MLSTVSLRPYQEAAINSLIGSFRSGHRKSVLQVPTGGGKTRIATVIIQMALHKGNRVLFICDREELINQTSAAFDAAGIDHGVIQGNHWRSKLAAPVQVATAQTLARRRWPDVGLVIWDECHTVYQTVLKQMDKWNKLKFIGLSATPFTKGMANNWDDLVIGSTTQDLIDQGFLCPYEIYGPPPADLTGVKTLAGDYHQGDLAKAVSKKNIVGDVVKTWLSLGEGRQTICFAVDVAHSKHIVSEFQRYGIKAEHIDAYTDSDDRRKALEDFAAKRIQIISSVDILTKGYDQPQASCLIMARPTKSLIIHIQQIGRVLRIADGKENAIILDHGGNTERHGFPTDPLPDRLDEGKKKQQSESKKKPESLPKACSSCHYVKPAGVHECPQCGFAPEKQTMVESTDDKLVKIERVSTAEKGRWFAMFLGYAKDRGYSDGWASHKYKEKFGVWPHIKHGVIPTSPDSEVLNYIKHLNIKYAKSKKPKPVATHCRYCNSTDLVTAPGSGPHGNQLRCGSCDKHLQWLPKQDAVSQSYRRSA